MAWTTLYSATNGTSNGGKGDTRRIVIAATALATTANTVRVLFHYSGSGSYTMTDVYIGLQATSGDAWDIDPSTMVRLTQGGNTTFTVTSGAVYSDSATLVVDGTRAVVISLYGGTNLHYLAGTVPDGLSTYRRTGNYAGTADASSLSTSLTNLLGFRGLEGDILYSINEASVTSGPGEVVASGDSFFVSGNIEAQVGIVVGGGDSYPPPRLGTGSVFSPVPKLSGVGSGVDSFIIAIANLNQHVETVSGESANSIRAWGRCLDASRVFGRGHGNVLSLANFTQEVSIISGRAVAQYSGNVSVLVKHSISAEGGITQNIAVGTGRIRPTTDSVDATSSLFVSGLGGFSARTPTVSAAGESAVACVGIISPARPRISAATRAATPSFSFLRDSRSAPTSAASLPLNILRFERS